MLLSAPTTHLSGVPLWLVGVLVLLLQLLAGQLLRVVSLAGRPPASMLSTGKHCEVYMYSHIPYLRLLSGSWSYRTRFSLICYSSCPTTTKVCRLSCARGKPTPQITDEHFSPSHGHSHFNNVTLPGLFACMQKGALTLAIAPYVFPLLILPVHQGCADLATMLLQSKATSGCAQRAGIRSGSLHRVHPIAAPRRLVVADASLKDTAAVPVMEKGELNVFPEQPAVYAVYDKEGAVQYIGLTRKVRRSVELVLGGPTVSAAANNCASRKHGSTDWQVQRTPTSRRHGKADIGE